MKKRLRKKLKVKTVGPRKIRGFWNRPTLIIMDDLEDDIPLTLEQREKLKYWYDEVKLKLEEEGR